ncbi:Polyketide cyclase / dehydrase and lipid transport [Nocardia otitidiscaviarum]|uniref:Polyketide cyclase / dehydrase and lipid transport n=1 Tax=Nocardia otitidiscaviarum TaxID=1823 RepID=A0A378YTH7_9NOCA|nr:SRPBCC family protein [Nocardia otitidiscaviarum]SUA80462.1 Polyketide cyclase / dehydrase and lipid transport [Nocardia otitidiscaviarum]
MPSFDDHAHSAAAPEDVWQLLYDPGRFPEWWAGIGSVDPAPDAQPDRYTMYPDGYPDFPMPQTLRTDRHDRRVIISCLISDLRFEWRLVPAPSGTDIHVHVELPDTEAARLETQRRIVRDSVSALAALAAGGHHSAGSASPRA